MQKLQLISLHTRRGDHPIAFHGSIWAVAWPSSGPSSWDVVAYLQHAPGRLSLRECIASLLSIYLFYCFVSTIDFKTSERGNSSTVTIQKTWRCRRRRPTWGCRILSLVRNDKGMWTTTMPYVYIYVLNRSHANQSRYVGPPRCPDLVFASIS
jgi:hypothetical protein